MSTMFGALNRFISRLDEQPAQRGGSQVTGYGFQVLRNKSPDLAIDPWFDFIVGINGRNIDNSDGNLFATEVRNCAGSTISLGVYSAKGNQIRELFVPVADSGLGVSLQWAPLAIAENVWHILDVIPNSPSDNAGLLPYSDYVIGSPEGSVKGEHGLAELIEDHMDRPLRLYVYNHEYDVTRTVTITPSRGWGGDGALGCVLGFGALHRLPAPLSEPTQAPGETLFESARFSNEESRPSPSVQQAGFQPSPAAPQSEPTFLVPANMSFAPPPAVTSPSDGPPKSARKARAAHVLSPGAGIDDYFKEGEEKSRELDRGSTPKNAGAGLPPPPKGGSSVPPPPKAKQADT